jgi:hypothetical protein
MTKTKKQKKASTTGTKVFWGEEMAQSCHHIL